MDPTPRCRYLFVLLLFGLLGLQTARPARAEEPAPRTAGDAAIDADELDLRLLPLRKEQLAVEAEAWAGLLEQKIQEIADTRIAIARAEGEEKDKLLERIDELQDDRRALLKRMDVVIEAWESKGGDTAELRTYVDQVAGIKLAVTDVSTAWTLFVNWLKAPEGGVALAKHLFFFLLLLLVTRVVARLSAAIVRRGLDRVQRTPQLLRKFLVNVTRSLVTFLGVVIALSVLGIDIGPLLAVLGAAGFAIAFALQGTLANFANGVMILLYRPFDVGDFVNAGGVSGTVEAVNLVSTTIKSPDNQVLLVPNSEIWGNTITNITGVETRRVDMVFGVGYGDDLAKAHDVLEKILADHELVLAEPAPSVKVAALADSSVNFNVRPWVKTEDYWTVYWDVTRAVKERFDAEGLSIPFPQRDVHVYQNA